MRPTLSSVSNLLSRGACSLLLTSIVSYSLSFLSKLLSVFALLLPNFLYVFVSVPAALI